jgi:hypothetical protein
MTERSSRSVLAAAVLAILAGLGAASCRSRGPEQEAPAGKPAPTLGTAPAPAGSPVEMAFTGSFSAQGDSRRVEARCPGCRKPVAMKAARCPECRTALAWPEKVRCGFCAGAKPGACPVCGATGKCPSCPTARMLMGLRPPCDVCNNTGKCAACGGDGRCRWCEEGWHRPGSASDPQRSTGVPSTVP